MKQREDFLYYYIKEYAFITEHQNQIKLMLFPS